MASEQLSLQVFVILVSIALEVHSHRHLPIHQLEDCAHVVVSVNLAPLIQVLVRREHTIILPEEDLRTTVTHAHPGTIVPDPICHYLRVCAQLVGIVLEVPVCQRSLRCLQATSLMKVLPHHNPVSLEHTVLLRSRPFVLIARREIIVQHWLARTTLCVQLEIIALKSRPSQLHVLREPTPRRPVSKT